MFVGTGGTPSLIIPEPLFGENSADRGDYAASQAQGEENVYDDSGYSGLVWRDEIHVDVNRIVSFELLGDDS